MRTVHAVGLMAFTLAALSCATVQPVKISAGDQCFRCQRPIADTRLAAEQITGFVEKFRTPGCMAKYVAKNPGDAGAAFVTDFSTGTMIDVHAAVFVPVVLDDVTNARDYRAYALQADARAAADTLHVSPVDWNSVVDTFRAF